MENKRHLGIDYGSKRIGLALSDPLNIIAQGFGVVLNSPAAIHEIKKVIEQYAIISIVIGIPYNLKGQAGKSVDVVEQFITSLQKEVGIPIVRWDERFTSTRVHQTLREMGVKKKQRQSKEKIDALAAALILQSYLDSPKHRTI